MLEDLDSGKDIARHTARLLKVADAKGRLPTPVDDIVAAAKLVEPSESVLSESALAGAPAHLQAAMRKMRGKVHAVLDRKAREIHVSPDIAHDGKRRFKLCHEVTHHLLPWQEETAYADDAQTLSPQVRADFEREANQGGAELLFQRELLQKMAADYKIGFGAILDLADQFGASKHATFRRYVETHRGPVAGMVLNVSPDRADPLTYYRREGMNSRSWNQSYDAMHEWPKHICAKPFAFVTGIRSLQTSPLASVLPYPDLNNEQTSLNVEVWSNGYSVFVLLWVPQRERLKRTRIIVPHSRAA